MEFKYFLKLLVAGSAAAWMAASLPADAQGLPNVIMEPQAINLGGTSFFDAFAPPVPGLVYIQVDRGAFTNRIVDYQGHTVPTFNHPNITTLAQIHELLWTTPVKIGEGFLGFNTILPTTDIISTSSPPGPFQTTLRSNGIGIGDLTVGPYWQSFPVMKDDYNPLYFIRWELDVTAPTGKFSSNYDINPSAGMWSVTPNVAVTYFPTDKIEISARLNYMYNFQTKAFPNAPNPIFFGLPPTFTYKNGQAGALAWINLASSYKVSEQLSIGVNSYYSDQLNNNKLNGMNIANSRQEQFYAGPGFHYFFDPKNIVDVNFYAPVVVRNVASGPQFNIHYIHPF